jgi:hypothetical protein
MKRWINLIGATLLVVGLSCTTATDGDVSGTILETLNEFVDAWNSCDIDTYKELLTDDFTFYFDTADVGGGHDIPPSWGYDEEIAAVGNLFEAVGAPNVEVLLELDDIAEPEEGATTYTVTDVHYDVTVYFEDWDGGPVTFLGSGHLDMDLMYTDGVWVITKWWDKFSQSLLGCNTSWGSIKAEFY